MQPRLRKLVTAFMLAVALVLGWQRPSVLACAMDDTGCRDRCAIMAASCATACPAPIAPLPVTLLAPRASAEAIAFSFDQPVLHGLVIAPDTAPPRLSA